MAESFITIQANVKKLSDHVAGSRREALANILEYAKKSPLSIEDGEVLKNGLLPMFVEKQPLVYTQFVDTLEGILVCWNHQVKGWIYMIVSKFLQKLGTDIIRDVLEKKVKSLLINMTKYCDGGLLLACLFRAYSDASQPMNRRTIKESLLYLGQICFKLEQGNFTTSAETSLGFSAIAGWYSNKNAYKDIQKAARYALLALFRLNSSTFLQLQTELPATKEPWVRQLINAEILPDSPSPLEEFMFLSPFRGSFDTYASSTSSYSTMTPPLKYGIDTTSKTTTPSSTHSDYLDVLGSPKRSVSSEDIATDLPAFKFPTQEAKKTSTLPRSPGGKTRTKLSLQPTSGGDSFSPTPSKLPLSRTQSVGGGLKKKPGKSGDVTIPQKFVSKIPRAETKEETDIYY